MIRLCDFENVVAALRRLDRLQFKPVRATVRPHHGDRLIKCSYKVGVAFKNAMVDKENSASGGTGGASRAR